MVLEMSQIEAKINSTMEGVSTRDKPYKGISMIDSTAVGSQKLAILPLQLVSHPKTYSWMLYIRRYGVSNDIYVNVVREKLISSFFPQEECNFNNHYTDPTFFK